jgi:hypothetical protein
MDKQEAIRILVLLSQMEGFLLGKVGDHCLPDWIAEELSDVCELLAKKVSDES